MSHVLLETRIENLELIHRGKVRDIYDLGERLLFVTTDRISAFDVVLGCGIPHKGEALTQISAFWFDRFADRVAHHLVTTDPSQVGIDLGRWSDALRGRSMVVEKVRPFPFEFIVRGYVTGSSWASYQETGAICGIPLPKGLKRHQRLQEPILTPTTKAQSGHDQDIEPARVAEALGKTRYQRIEEIALDLFKAASDRARERGILIADTKLELGERKGEIVLIDEVFTPDSSRFWPADAYTPGAETIASYDKQIMRDYLISTGWDRNPPPPPVPQEIVERTSRRYVEIFELLTGQKLITSTPAPA